jgi:riboflavin synthase
VLRLITPKCLVAPDGFSLTVNEVEGSRFGVNLIPYTLAHTSLGDAAPGRRMNLEIDPIARYVARLLGPRADERTTG